MRPQRLSESVVDYLSPTPTFSKDGSVIYTIKSGYDAYVVDAKTGWLFGSTRHVDNGLTKNDLPELILQIFRADYFLTSFGPKLGSIITSWNMTVSEFKAILICRGDNDNDLNFAMPYACGDKIPKQVFRQRR